MLRSVYDDKRSAGSSEDKQFTRDLNELTQFVKAGRLHTVSLQRPYSVSSSSRPMRTIGLLIHLFGSNLSHLHVVRTLRPTQPPSTSPLPFSSHNPFTTNSFGTNRNSSSDTTPFKAYPPKTESQQPLNESDCPARPVTSRGKSSDAAGPSRMKARTGVEMRKAEDKLGGGREIEGALGCMRYEGHFLYR